MGNTNDAIYLPFAIINFRQEGVFMYHIFIAIIFIFICYKHGDWRNRKNYYPTILFFILNSVNIGTGVISCRIKTYREEY